MPSQPEPEKRLGNEEPMTFLLQAVEDSSAKELKPIFSLDAYCVGRLRLPSEAASVTMVSLLLTLQACA